MRISSDSYRDRLLEKIKKEALEVKTERKLSSGRKSGFYIDGKLITLDAEGAFLTAKAFYDALDSVEFDAVGGLTIGADPIVASLAVLSYINGRPIPAFIVRKEPKVHGTMKLIEGRLVRGAKVVLVDDVATTGQSILRAIDAVEGEGCQVVKIIVLVDRQEGAGEKFKALGYDFDPIFTRKGLGISDEY